MRAVVDNLDAYWQGFVTTVALTALSSVLALALGTVQPSTADEAA